MVLVLIISHEKFLLETQEIESQVLWAPHHVVEEQLVMGFIRRSTDRQNIPRYHREDLGMVDSKRNMSTWAVDGSLVDHLIELKQKK